MEKRDSFAGAVNTSRVKREVIVRQISLNLTDLYTLNAHQLYLFLIIFDTARCNDRDRYNLGDYRISERCCAKVG